MANLKTSHTLHYRSKPLPAFLRIGLLRLASPCSSSLYTIDNESVSTLEYGPTVGRPARELGTHRVEGAPPCCFPGKLKWFSSLLVIALRSLFGGDNRQWACPRVHIVDSWHLPLHRERATLARVVRQSRKLEILNP